jgi:NAD(P)-dependent dehydrogenase (short-subunit alcohol dehydrogenase family)
MLETINVNSAGPLRVVEALLPMMHEKGRRRLCFVSSEAGSVTRSWRDNYYCYCMSKSALNMGVSILFKDLRKDGFTFRVYHPGYIRSYMLGQKNLEATLEPEEAAELALSYFLSAEGSVDEDRLAMRDFEGQEWPW